MTLQIWLSNSTFTLFKEVINDSFRFNTDICGNLLMNAATFSDGVILKMFFQLKLLVLVKKL